MSKSLKVHAACVCERMYASVFCVHTCARAYTYTHIQTYAHTRAYIHNCIHTHAHT